MIGSTPLRRSLPGPHRCRTRLLPHDDAAEDKADEDPDGEQADDEAEQLMLVAFGTLSVRSSSP